MVGWRHGFRFSSNALYRDGHVSLLTPRVPSSPAELLKTVDTVGTFTWLPAEKPNRFDFASYQGEIVDWRGRLPEFVRSPGKIIAGNQSVPYDFPEKLSCNWRTVNRAWRKLPDTDRERF